MTRNPDNRRVEDALRRLAERQHNVAARRHLREIGLTASAVDERLARGRLAPIHRGVYALFHQRPTHEGQWLAAVLACGPGAVLSHGDAAMHFELLRYEPGPVHVTVPRGSGRRSRPDIVVHRCDLTGRDVTIRNGIPVTIVTRTLLDLAPSLPRRTLERAIDEAIYLKKANENTLRSAPSATRTDPERGR